MGISQALSILILRRLSRNFCLGQTPRSPNHRSAVILWKRLFWSFIVNSAQSVPLPCTCDHLSRITLIIHSFMDASAKYLRAKDRAMNNHFYPKIYYPEVYILEGGYCQYFRTSPHRCEPPSYVKMDDPKHLASRREDLDQFRKAKFGRHKSYAFGDIGGKALQSSKRNTAPSNGSNNLFVAANTARPRRSGGSGGTVLMPLAEDVNNTCDTDDTDTDIGDSPCPPPTRTAPFRGKKLGRAPLARAETYGPSRMPF